MLRLVLLLIFSVTGIVTVMYGLHIPGQGGYTSKQGPVGQGCTCHSQKRTDSVSIRINGPSRLKVGEKGQYEVLLSRSGFRSGGFNAAVKRGTLIPADNSTIITYGEIAHSKAQSSDEFDIMRWKFIYQAPERGDMPDTIFITGLVSNNDGKISGDQWNHGKYFPLTIVAPGIPSTVYNPEEIFQASIFQRENSASPILDLELMADADVKVEITTLNEKFVTILRNEHLMKGQHIVPIPAGPLDAGEYYCIISVGNELDRIKFRIDK
jgi:hypothetical protein